MWYPISFLATTVFLILWSYFSFHKKEGKAYAFRQFFLLSISSYLFTLLSSDILWADKFSVLSVDLMCMGGIAFFFGLVRSQKAVFWLFFIGIMSFVLSIGLKKIDDRVDAKSIFGSSGVVACGTPFIKEEILIELQNPNDIAVIEAEYGVLLTPAFQIDHSTLLSDWYFVNIPQYLESETQTIKKQLKQYGEVEINDQVTVAPLKSGKLPNINLKFGINDPGLEHMWGFESMQVNRLYEYLKQEKIKPKKKARIAILDTGVDAQHEDLKDNYYSTQNKYDSDVRGHGTHCAGIAAAVSNNGKGTASFSPNSDFVEITSIKVLNNFGMGTQKTIIDGMIEAADSGVDVISMSLGSFSTDERQKAYSEAVQYCKEKGTIVVVAAGNSNTNGKKFAPANADGVIAVSALQQDLQKAGFSNTVHELEMGLAAPGKDIYSSTPGSKYDTFSGTSMAAPYVAGLIGLMKSLQPELTAEEAYQILNKTGQKTKSGSATGMLIMPFDAVKEVYSIVK